MATNAATVLGERLKRHDQIQRWLFQECRTR